MVGLFLVAFALILRELPRTERRAPGADRRPRRPRGRLDRRLQLPGPGLAGRHRRDLGPRRVRPRIPPRAACRRCAPGSARRRRCCWSGSAVLAVFAVAELPRIQGLHRRGRLRHGQGDRLEAALPRPAPEAFGVWPSGEWLFGYSAIGLEAWQLFAAIGLIAFGFAAWWWLRRGDVALPAAVAASAVVYLWHRSPRPASTSRRRRCRSRPSLIMLFILGALLLPSVRRRRGASPAELEPEARPPGSAREGIGLRALIAVPFIGARRLLQLPRPARRRDRPAATASTSSRRSARRPPASRCST